MRYALVHCSEHSFGTDMLLLFSTDQVMEGYLAGVRLIDPPLSSLERVLDSIHLLLSFAVRPLVRLASHGSFLKTWEFALEK